MKQITGAMSALLAKNSIDYLSMFWTVTRADGVVLGFTDFDQDVTVGGVTYEAESGFSRSAIQQQVDLAIPNFDVTGIVSSDRITDEDIRAGLYDGATILIFMAVPTDANFAAYGTIPLPGYYLGEIKIQDGIYTCECRGIAYALTQSFIEVFTPTCRADFGDPRCKKNLALLTDTGTVTAVVNNSFFAATLDTGNGAGFYNFGLVTWNTGNNAAASMEVQQWSGGNTLIGTLVLYLPMGKTIQVGDTFTIVAGCDKSYNPNPGNQGCYLWSNTDNFRGEPFIPGLNFLFDYGIVEP